MQRLIFASFLILSACSKDVWKHNNLEAMNMDRDLAECQYEAKKALASYSINDPGRAGHSVTVITLIGLYDIRSRKKDIIRSCMQLKGYYLDDN